MARSFFFGGMERNERNRPGAGITEYEEFLGFISIRTTWDGVLFWMAWHSIETANRAG